jgi:hypothetical protein
MRNEKGQFVKGHHHSYESKKKISESHKGEKHPLFGKHHSPEARKKMSNNRKGKCVGEKSPSKRPEVRAKMSESKKGDKSYRWKGGICTDKDNRAYVYISQNHPLFPSLTKNCNYIQRSHLVWWENTGETIRRPYLIHHINGDPGDDRFENLQRMTFHGHTTYHRIKDSLRPKIELTKTEKQFRKIMNELDELTVG